MKRIIDIDEEIYQEIKTGHFPLNITNACVYAVTHSTPYNPSGELISREALKKAIHNSNLSGNREWLLMELNDIIDNAPTVEE